MNVGARTACVHRIRVWSESTPAPVVTIESLTELGPGILAERDSAT